MDKDKKELRKIEWDEIPLLALQELASVAMGQVIAFVAAFFLAKYLVRWVPWYTTLPLFALGVYVGWRWICEVPLWLVHRGLDKKYITKLGEMGPPD